MTGIGGRATERAVAAGDGGAAGSTRQWGGVWQWGRGAGSGRQVGHPGAKLAARLGFRPLSQRGGGPYAFSGMTSSPVDLPNHPGVRHLGDLARGETAWRVYLETKSGEPGGGGVGGAVRGRIHFVAGEAARSTGWIFVEPSDQDLVRRFQDFSAVELWKLLESLG